MPVKMDLDTMTPLPPRAVEAWLAVSVLHAENGHVTIRDVQSRMDLHSPDTALKWLRVARDFGMVDWADRLSGTLRPTMRIVLGPRDLDVDGDL